MKIIVYSDERTDKKIQDFQIAWVQVETAGGQREQSCLLKEGSHKKTGFRF